MNHQAGAKHFPRWIWLWIPVAYLPFEWAVNIFDRNGAVYERIFLHEQGVVENATAILLIPAIIFGIRRTRQLLGAGARPAAGLLLFYVLGCLFLLGEETSYGQHIFGWESPEYFKAQNAQKETNLHNLKFVDKNAMKWLLLLGMLTVGIVLPLAFRRSGVPSRMAQSSLAPLLVRSMVCLPVAAMAIGMHLLVKTFHWFLGIEFHDQGFVDMRETTELYIAYFLLLYPTALVLRHDAAAAQDTAHSTAHRHD